MLASVAVQTVLLLLKLCFLVLLYLFIWRIVRSATKEVRLPQESFILAPREAAAVGLGRGARSFGARISEHCRECSRKRLAIARGA